MTQIDLLALTARLINIPSVSRSEGALADFIEERFSSLPWLETHRVGDNVVARTQLGLSQRLALLGHLDTVPPNGNEQARIVGEKVYGLGASDMKGGLAVMLALAETLTKPHVDFSCVFYAREEVGRAENGLLELEAARPDLLEADAAVLGEPTGGALEVGCQGTMHIRATLRGERAHTARPWMGRNAIHRLADLLKALEGYEGRRPLIDGCEFREALMATAVSGGVAGNVVPDEVELKLNHRFAPDRSAEQAEAHVREVLEMHLRPGDVIEVIEAAPGAHPGLAHPLLSTLLEALGGRSQVLAKLGWTDVAFFAERGVPAVNFGPGASELAHTEGEFVTAGSLQLVYDALAGLLTSRGRASP